jgi:hypothetical protein
METFLFQMLLELHPELFPDETDNPMADMIVNIVMGARQHVWKDNLDSMNTDIVSTYHLPDDLKCVVYHILGLFDDPTSTWATSFLVALAQTIPEPQAETKTKTKTKPVKTKPVKTKTKTKPVKTRPVAAKAKTVHKPKSKVTTGINADEVARCFMDITTGSDFGTEDKQNAQRIRNSISSKETWRKNVEKERTALRLANMEEFVAAAEKNARADVESHQQRIQKEIDNKEKQRASYMEVSKQTEMERRIADDEMVRGCTESAQRPVDLAHLDLKKRRSSQMA